MPSGAAGVPCVLGGAEGAAGQGSSHHPSQEWGSWGHQGSPSPGHWAGTSPGWDVAGQQEGVSYGLGSHSQPGAAPKAARFSAGCSPHSPAGSLSPRYSGTAAAPGCSSVPHSHSQSPRSGMLPGALHRAADKPCSFAQAWQAIPFFHVFYIQGNYLVSIRA